MTLHRPQFRLILDIRLPQHEPWVPLGRRNLALAGQDKQPYLLVRPVSFLLSFFVRLDRWPSDDRCQFGGDSCEYTRWGQHPEMRDTLRVIRMFGF
jgi:hypothetical protein